MEPRKLPKSKLFDFLKKLGKYGEVIAPIKTDILRFASITDYKKIDLEGHPLFTAKKYFYDSKKDLFRYGKHGIKEVKYNKKYVIFGMRLCDVNSLLKLDRLFLDENEDEIYRRARENNLIIGLNCEIAPKKVCFCESMDLKHEGYDLFFCDARQDFHILIGSKKGEKLVKDLPLSNHTEKSIHTQKKLEHKDIEQDYDDKLWGKESSKCVSCGACTTLCPNCLCFDVFDTPSILLKSGTRMIEWDSCQYKDFTKVAGEHVFRSSRESRLKHRVYHKLVYYWQRYGDYMCTGCGRCIEGCPTNIDFVEIINKIKK